MKVMILPDLHGRKFWRKAIKDNINNVDKVVFLGDYLDPYSDEIIDTPETMECKSFDDSESLLNMLNDIVALKKKNPEKVILLCGNHTCSYIWEDFSEASRTDHKNWDKYHKFFIDNLDLFQIVYRIDDVIFSHAGILESWARNFLSKFYDKPEIEESTSLIKDCVEFLNLNFLKDYTFTIVRGLSDISKYRGGWSPYGSCEWADLNEHVDKVIDVQKKEFIGKGEDGIFQIFGHTQLREPLRCDKWVCVDCHKGFIYNTKDGSLNSL